MFSDLGEASRHADAAHATVFVKIRDRFNAPQFLSGSGVTLVNSEGYLVLEKGDAGDYDYKDDYYRGPARMVTVSASLLKMPGSSKGMARTGHDAMYIRGFHGRDVLIEIFGILIPTPDYFQIKPYAIWC
jgi:hypothetical protein